MRQFLQTSTAIAKASFKVRNEGNYLGILWYLLDPLLFFLMFFLIRDILGSDIKYYALYLLIGLTLFNFFRKTTSYATRSITSNAKLVTDLNINLEIFPFSTVLLAIFTHLFEVIIIGGVMIILGIPLFYLMFYPLVFIALWIFTLGLTYIVSSISVYINDFANIWGVFTRILWFATPIFYSARLDLPFDINTYNPMYYFIQMTRDILIDHQIPEKRIIIITIVFSLVTLIIGRFIFNKSKKGFAERL